ncbi:hypothetical protein FRC10_009191 [Ceratobasidium sp. 414]|nr:hypothetical protein FRC10_009191 [Ceratobasidium sp. 414]
MVWGAVAHNAKGPIIQLEVTPRSLTSSGRKRGGGLSAQGYTDQVVSGPVKDFWEELTKERGQEILIVEDGAGPHKGKFGMEHLTHPPNSPDLNPIEPLWFLLKKRVAKIPGYCGSCDKLWAAIQQAWDSITIEEINKHTGKMDAWVEAVKAAKEFVPHIIHSAAILQHGLVVNKLGCADSFYPIDQHQEFNNAGIKNYGPPPQNASWEQYGKISSVIPFFMDMVEHVEYSITGISRSHIHKNPKHDKDVKALIDNHLKNQVHEILPGCQLAASNKVKDTHAEGISAIQNRDILSEYHSKRDIHRTASSNRQQLKDTPTPPNSPAPTMQTTPPLCLEAGMAPAK